MSKSQIRKQIGRNVYNAYNSFLKAVEARNAPAGTCDGYSEMSWLDNGAVNLAEVERLAVELGWTERQARRIGENLLNVTGA